MSRVSNTSLTLTDRLSHGNLTIAELSALSKRGRSSIYNDLAAGKLAIIKIGNRTLIPGPIAARYIGGKPIDDLVATEVAE